jgi:TP901 family phage tail tape measure protein
MGKMDKSLTKAIAQATKDVSDFSTNISKIGKIGLAAITTLATGTAATIADCTKEAKNFEAEMADVVKYVNGLADANGNISDSVDLDTGRTYAENYDLMKESILDLSMQIPMTEEELTQLAAAAGQSGKDINDMIQYDSDGNITGFLKDAAMMATAMDIDAAQAGDWMAKWEPALNMTHDQVMVLADQINYLGANSATTAAEIASVVNDTASLGQVAGVDASTTAALADAMLAMGVDSSKASTSIKRMYTNLSLGESATTAMKDAWSKLGTTAEDVAKGLQEDSVGTLQSIFQAIKELPEEEQVAELKNLFGNWAIEGSAKIVGNIDAYEEALAMVMDPEKYSGSMLKEFIIKSSTTEAIDTMLSNSLQALKIDMGDAFLPAKKAFSSALIDIIYGLRKNAPELQEIATSLATMFASAVEKAGKALEYALPYVKSILGYMADNGDKVVAVIGGITAAFAGMTAAPAIESVVKTVLGSSGSTATGTKASGIIGTIENTKNTVASGKNTLGLLGSGIQQGITSNASGKTGILGKIKSGAAGLLVTQSNLKGLTSGTANQRAQASQNVANTISNLQNNGGLGGLVKSMFGQTKTGQYAGSVKNAIANVGNTRVGSGIGATIGNAKNFAGSAISNTLLNAKGKIVYAKQVAGNTVGNIAGIAKTGLGNAATTIANSKPGQAVGNAITTVVNSKPVQVVGGAAKTVGGAISTVGNMAKTGLGNAGNILKTVLPSAGYAVAEFGSSLLGTASTILSPIGGMFSTVMTGALPIVGIISSIIAVVSILYGKMDSVREVVGNVFGDTGLAVFDAFKGKIDETVTFVSGILHGGLADVLSGVREKLVGLFDGDAAGQAGATFDAVVMVVQSVLGVIGQLVDFANTNVKPIIEEIFSYLTTTVLPIVLNTFQAAAPVISSILTNVGTAVMTVASIIAQAIKFALPIIESIITVVLTVGSVVVPALLAAFDSIWSGINAVLTDIQTIFNGLITFITGVFTGNWEKAWEGVKEIFSGAFSALVDLCKVPINAVIALINKAIEGINGLGLTIPDWVPLLGGKSFTINIPTIKALAKGGFTDGVSIAGEAGTEAVISFDPTVRQQNIETWATAGKMLGVGDLYQTSQTYSTSNGWQENNIEQLFDRSRQVLAELPSIPNIMSNRQTNQLEEIEVNNYQNESSGQSGSIVFAPNITIQGNADQSTVDYMIDEMESAFERWYEQKRKLEMRTAY